MNAINFTERKADKKRLFLGIKQDNNAEVLTITVASEIVNATRTAYLLVKSEFIVDKVELPYTIANGILTANFGLVEKYTTAELLQCQIVIEDNDFAWHTEMFYIELGEVVNIETVVDVLPTVLKDLEDRVTVLEQAQLPDIDNVPTENSQNLVKSGGVWQAIRGNKFEIAISGKTITITFSDGTQKTADLPIDKVIKSGSYNAETKEIELTLTDDSVIKIPVGDLVDIYETDNVTLETYVENEVTKFRVKNGVFVKTDEIDQSIQLKMYTTDIYGNLEISNIPLSNLKSIGDRGTLISKTVFDMQKNLHFTNVEIDSWTIDSGEYAFVTEFSNINIKSTDVASVVFGLTEALSGDYAPIAETFDGGVKIWANVDNTIIIPTITILRG